MPSILASDPDPSSFDFKILVMGISDTLWMGEEYCK